MLGSIGTSFPANYFAHTTTYLILQKSTSIMTLRLNIMIRYHTLIRKISLAIWTNKVDGRVFDRYIKDFSIAQNLGSVESLIFDYGPKQWRGRHSSFLGWEFAMNLFNYRLEVSVSSILLRSFRKFP